MQDPSFSVKRLPREPHVTLALVSYNSVDYIEEATVSVLNQDYPEIELLLSDDGSTDSTFQRMFATARKLGAGRPLKISRRVPNLGLASHVNEIFSQASGDIIIFAAGDDVSLPHRVRETIKAFLQFPNAMAVSFTDDVINAQSEIIQSAPPGGSVQVLTLQSLFVEPNKHPSGASRAYRKEVFHQFGPLDINCPTEDTPLMLRSLMLGDIVTCAFPAIQYRRHSGSLTGGSRYLGMNLEVIRNQQLRDLTYALKMHFIDSATFSRIQKWVWLRYFYLSLTRRSSAIDLKPLLRLCVSLVSRELSCRDKSLLFRQVVSTYIHRVVGRRRTRVVSP